MSWRLAGAIVVAVLTAATGSASGAPSTPAFLVLLDDNRLELRSAIGARVGSIALPAAFDQRLAGHYLAVAPDRETAYVLQPRGAHGQRIAVVDLAARSVQRLLGVPTRFRYSALAVGPRTGRVFAFARRVSRRGVSAPAGAWLVVVDPAPGRSIARLVRRAAGRDWWTYAGTVSRDERRLLVGYHGAGTTGADLVDLHTFGRCREQPLPHAGCISRTHGAVAAVPGGFVGTTGELGAVLAVRAKPREWDVRLPGNHLVELAVDGSGRHVYPFGGCEYAGGVSRVELRSGRVTVLARPARRGATPRVCGARGAVAGTTLALAGRGLLLIGTRTGRVLRDIPLDAQPLDIAAVG